MTINTRTSYSPLGLNSWGPEGYSHALNVAYDHLDAYESASNLDRFVATMARNSLANSLLRQAERNHVTDDSTIGDSVLGDRLRDGLCEPAEAVMAFYEVLPEEVTSIETARLTHVGEWDTNALIDTPVRDSLLTVQETTATKDSAHYKIKTLGLSPVNNEKIHTVGIMRKRAVAEHFGGRVVSVVVNSLLLDLANLPPDLAGLEADIKHQWLHARETKSDVDVDARMEYLNHDFLEHAIKTRNLDEKPSGVIPLTTVYYATKASAKQN